MIDQHREAFKEEASELLSDLENSLLDLEKNPENLELVGGIFRAMHTIKGSGAMFGFDDIAALMHNVESAYDRIRNGKLQVTGELISLTLAVCDQVRRLIDGSNSGTRNDEKVGTFIEAFREILDGCDSGEKAKTSSPEPNDAAPVSSEGTTYRIRFQPKAQIFANGTNPLPLLQELLELGAGRLIAQTQSVPALDEIDPETCYVYWDIILTTSRGINAIRDVFIFVEEGCDLSIEEIDRSSVAENAEDRKELGVILVESTAQESGAIRVAPAGDERRAESRRKRSTEQSSSIRVQADKLDRLVNMVGELVTVQSRLTQIASEQNHPQIVRVAEDVERLVAELRDTTMSIRMLPIGTAFSKFRRLVHDLAKELGKEIALVTQGEDTEIDKTVIERLNDPLVHLIRNSIDHGIEPPDVRKAQGKSAKGTITLSAEHSGTSVVIRITDDGAGLDAEAIRAKAIERGLIGADASLSEHEIHQLILQPGLSTAGKLTSVSGRGVGMDVVKRNVEALQGTVEIDSRRGAGATMTLVLPLTLAIIDGLLVEIGEESYVLPLSAVEECVELNHSESGRDNGQNLAMIRGELVPYIPVRDLFGIEGTPPTIEQIVTAKIDGSRVGFVVDRVIGQHQTVIKTLGRVYKDVDVVSGATILGDGRVVLILDLPKVVKKAERCTRTPDNSGRAA